MLHRIYDEESDRHVHIPFLQALFATCYGHNEGPQGDLFGLATLSTTDGQKYDRHYQSVVAELPTGAALVQSPAEMGAQVAVPANAAAWRNLGTAIKTAMNASPFVNATAVAACLNAAKAVAAAVSNGIWCPAEIVIARPFIEHLMLSAIVTVSGRDTGATLFGPADMCATWNSNPNSSSMPSRSQI